MRSGGFCALLLAAPAALAQPQSPLVRNVTQACQNRRRLSDASEAAGAPASAAAGAPARMEALEYAVAQLVGQHPEQLKSKDDQLQLSKPCLAVRTPHSAASSARLSHPPDC